MAVTVRDCLEIGVLKDSTVIAGAQGLDRLVESVSVLEFDGISGDYALADILTGHEMMITAFSCFKDSEPAVWQNFFNAITRVEVSCIVVFYLGTVVDKLPDLCIETANAQNLPLIMLPRESYVSYTDVIMPVAEAIISDRKKSNMFMSDVIYRLEQGAESEQNLQVLLDLLHEEMQADLILADASFSTFVMSCSPSVGDSRDIMSAIRSVCGNLSLLRVLQVRINVSGRELYARLQPVRTNNYAGVLISLRPDGGFDVDAMNQASEVLSLFLRVWRFGRGTMGELAALLEGSSTKKTAFRHMAVLRGEGGLPIDGSIDDLTLRRVADASRILVGNESYPMAYFDGSIVFASAYMDARFDKLLTRFIGEYGVKAQVFLGQADVLDNRNVQRTYQYIKAALPAAGKIFSRAQCFTYAQISFAHDVLQASQGDDSQVAMLLDVLTPLRTDREWSKYYQTLCAVYLDHGASLKEAAYHLKVHINTLKYRIKNINELLHLDLHDSISAARVVLALGLLKISE